MSNPKASFQDFTNLYEISKTLRFELKPIGETLSTLKSDGIIENDREIEENYHLIKELLDNLHILFVEKSLENADLSLLDNFYNSYIDLKKDSKNKENISNFEKVTKNIRKELVSFFENEGDSWLKKYDFLKKGGIGFLTEKEILELLKILNPERSEIIEKFDRFFTYFTNFNESRKNFYSDDGRAGAIATRTIDENLITFIENIERFDSFYKENENWVNENFSEREKEIFKLDFYNSCLLQKGIDDYNKIIGGYSEENGNKIAGINEKINLYKQQETHNNSKDKKFPKFDLLYKQILSKTDKKDFIIAIEDNEELFEILEKSKNTSLNKIKVFEKIFLDFFNKNRTYTLKNIYISKVGVNTISNKFFESWDSFKGYLGENKSDFINFSDIKLALENIEEKDIFKEKYYKEKIAFTEKNNYENFLNIFSYEFTSSILEVNKNVGDFEKLNLENFTKDEKQVEIIKSFLDSVLSFYSILKYFNIVKNKKKLEDYEKDGNFYNDYDNNFIDFEIWKDYNLVRNYLSKKDIKIDKFKLNFDNSQFLSGWDKDKEKERFGLILIKDGKYYLGILKKGFHSIFNDYTYKNEGDFYEKMEYKQLNNVYRQLPRLTFPLAKKLENLNGKEREKYIEKYKNNFGYNDEIAKIKEDFDMFQESKEKGEKFDIIKLKKLIKYYHKAVIFLYGKIYNLKEIENKDYEDLATFYGDIERRMYSLEFSKISSDFIGQQIENGNFYLFQIYNKDFSDIKKTGSKENIHTRYFKLLFDQKNLENLKIKLSGGAEIFFRDKTDNLKQKVKALKDSERSSEGQEEKLFYINKDGEKKEVIEHRRYSKDKILFHISITLNANAGDMYKFNSFINEKYINKNKDINIIGIDRGEKHLAYYSVIDKNGIILEVDTLNNVNGINYLELLEKKQKSRAIGRLSWGEIENIRNLKDGYVSGVVNKLTELIIKYNAVIVFEDLNSGFKRGRQKIEKQIYQKLELALAKKLNYITFKDNKDDEVGGYLHGIQLVGKVQDYADIGNYKQSGIMFYTNPAYTSTTCPNCGWRKTLKFPQKTTKQSVLNFFEDIKTSFKNNKFSFSYTYGDNKTSKEKEFTIFSDVKRIWFDSKKMENIEIDINKNLGELFKGFDLNIDINKQLEEKNLDSKFLNSLIFNFKLINQIRNSDSKNDKDIVSCPSCHYNSETKENISENGKNRNIEKLENADANGAYNIARKGLILLENIKNNSERPNLLVKDNDWDVFLGKKEITLLDIIND